MFVPALESRNFVTFVTIKLSSEATFCGIFSFAGKSYPLMIGLFLKRPPLDGFVGVTMLIEPVVVNLVSVPQLLS